MYDICCIGHITLDKIVADKAITFLPGGTAWYFSNAIGRMNPNYHLVTAVAENELRFVDTLRKDGISVSTLPSENTVCFENIYQQNQDHRVQKVTCKADPFAVTTAAGIASRIFHLGPLLADDMPAELVINLAKKAKVSLDVQGYLRQVNGTDVHATDWKEKKQLLPYIHFLKANESEAEVLTGSGDIYESAQILAEWGVKEVIITLGSKGSVVYAGKTFYEIPAWPPEIVKDATGCGDTYMAGYLFQRVRGNDIQQAGEFAAAMATIKIASSGAFSGNEKDVLQLLQQVSDNC